MKVKILGVELTPGEGITLDDLFGYIKQVGNKPTEINGYGRFLYVDEVDGYHVGLLITTKDHKAFLEFWHHPENAKLEPREVSEGAKFADFNFFAINKATGRGAYQFYHQSCTVNTFGMLCRSHYEKLKQSRMDEARAAQPKLSEKFEKGLRKQYAGSLKWEIMVRKEAFDQLMKEFDSIKSITLGVSTLVYEDTAFTALSHNANRMSQRYTFRSGTPVGALVKGMKDLLGKADIEAAKVEGVADGLDRVIKLANTPDAFGEFDFDEIAKDMKISPAQFASSPFLAQLIDVAKKAPALQE